MKTAERLFLEKYGNKITSSESWVIRFAEEHADNVASIRVAEETAELKEVIKKLDHCVESALFRHAEAIAERDRLRRALVIAEVEINALYKRVGFTNSNILDEVRAALSESGEKQND